MINGFHIFILLTVLGMLSCSETKKPADKPDSTVTRTDTASRANTIVLKTEPAEKPVSLNPYECRGEVEGFIADANGPTNFRDIPAGKIKRRADFSDGEHENVHVIADSSFGGWLHIKKLYDRDRDSVYAGFEGLWIYGSLVYVSLPDNSERKSVREQPSLDSKRISAIYGTSGIPIMGCCGKWAYTDFTDSDGKHIKGWIRPEFLCANPYTNCCGNINSD